LLAQLPSRKCSIVSCQREVPRSCEFNGGFSVPTGENFHASIHYCDGDDGCRGPIFIAGVRSEAELLLAMDTADTALMPAR
jgi:hypothetical protein